MLTCDADDVRGDALIYKVGLPRHQHLVKMKDRAGNVQIDIVRIDAGD